MPPRIQTLASAFAFALLTLAACPSPGDTPKEGKEKKALEHAAVTLQPPGRTLRIDAEVVRTEEDRARGLMFRKTLADRQGMLFIFPTQQVQHFWMKNTYIPLDMIFIDEAMKVVGVVHNAEPMTETRRSVEAPSRYVLEVKGGFCRREGVGEGTVVVFDGLKTKNQK